MAPSTSTTPAPKKRKSDATTVAASKKAKLSITQAETVKSILADANAFVLPTKDAETRALILELAQYARSLEEEVESYKPKAKSPEEMKNSAERLAAVARSGIQKQMKWKATCKTSGAKWAYDGVCTDPEVFGTLLGLGGPPTFKVKKFSADEFQELIGSVEASARYNDLYLKGDVNIHWKPDQGTFKFSGTYGV